MTPVERVEAAILRLETLQADSTPRPWHDWTDDLTNEVDVWHDQEARCHVANFGVAGERGVLADAELVSTLHSTVDPMLAILRDTLDLFRDPILIFMGREEQVFAAQLALADAILGDTK